MNSPVELVELEKKLVPPPPPLPQAEPVPPTTPEVSCRHWVPVRGDMVSCVTVVVARVDVGALKPAEVE